MGKKKGKQILAEVRIETDGLHKVYEEAQLCLYEDLSYNVETCFRPYYRFIYASYEFKIPETDWSNHRQIVRDRIQDSRKHQIDLWQSLAKAVKSGSQDSGGRHG